MKIILAVANHAYSFVIQANALAKGFSQINIDNKIKKTANTLIHQSASDFGFRVAVLVFHFREINQCQRIGIHPAKRYLRRCPVETRCQMGDRGVFAVRRNLDVVDHTAPAG